MTKFLAGVAAVCAVMLSGCDIPTEQELLASIAKEEARKTAWCRDRGGIVQLDKYLTFKGCSLGNVPAETKP